MKIKGKKFSEFETCEELSKAFEEELDGLAKEIIRSVQGASHMMTGLPQRSDFERYGTKVECYRAILGLIDQRFKTNYYSKSLKQESE